MLGLGLQATLNNQGSGQIHPVQNGLVLADNFRLSPVNDNLGLEFPSNGSAVFNGTSDYVDTPLLLTDYTNFTMSAWFYTENTNQGCIVSFGNSTNNTPISLIETRTTDVVRFSYRDDAGILITKDTPTYTKGIWNYVTAVKSGSNFSIYLNGSLGSTSSASTSAITLDLFSIGVLNQITKVNYFENNLANVAIWNRALSSDEINAVMWKDYDNLSASEQSGLQAWYSLDDISGTSVPDSTGNYNGTAY